MTLPLDLEITTTAPITQSASVSAEQTDPNDLVPVSVAGKLHETGKEDKVIGRAKIVARDARRTTQSDAFGRYSLGKLTPGKHTLQVLVSGKRIKETTLIVPADNYDIEI